jgi:hypothetical protein
MSWEPLHSTPSTLTDRLGKSDGVEVWRYTGVTAAGGKTSKLAVHGAASIYAVSSQQTFELELFDCVSGLKLPFANETAVKRGSSGTNQTAYWHYPPPWIVVKNNHATLAADIIVYVVRQHVKQKGR